MSYHSVPLQDAFELNAAPCHERRRVDGRGRVATHVCGAFPVIMPGTGVIVTSDRFRQRRFSLVPSSLVLVSVEKTWWWWWLPVNTWR